MRGSDLTRGLAVAAGLLAVPVAAHAHASDRMVIQTLPTGWYMAGAALAVLATLILGLLRPARPGQAGLAARVLFSRPVLLPRVWSSWVSALGLAALVALGFWGPADPLRNLLPLTLWTLIWVGLVLASALFGDLWRDLDPWTGPVRTIRRLIGRRQGIGLARLGHWPAVAGLAGFAWVEIVSLAPADPPGLARLVAAYYLTILILAVAEGEAWLARGEFLTVYFSLIAKIAPFWAEADPEGRRLRIMAAAPGARILHLPPLTPALTAFVTLALAAVSFDGLSETFWWLARIGINPLEFPGRSAVVWTNTGGLMGAWAICAALILIAIRAGQGRGAGAGAAGPVMLSFLPIATGYHIAHYLVALLTDGQWALAALSDPLGLGWNLLALPEHFVSFGFLATHAGVRAIWIAQFAAITGAHILAVRLGLALAPGTARPLAHLPMGLLMVVYTSVGLWLLAAPTAG